MSDPIPFWHDGVWHLFYEHNPNEPRWGAMSWGHASSTDLINWTHHPISLGPSEGSDRAGGVWGGSIVGTDHGFYAFYTRASDAMGGLQTQCGAYSPDLESWFKLPENPLIATPPPGFGPCFRDPKVFFEDGVWKMLVGSQREGVGGALLLYESKDLRAWTFVGPALLGQTAETGFDFESPDLFPLDDRWVLLTSRGASHWFVGDWDGRRFYPHRRGTCDGPEYSRFSHDASPFYSARTAAGPQGRRVMFGWARETQELHQPGWSGLLGIPRELKLLTDGSLGMNPVHEMRTLRREHLHLSPRTFPVWERTPMPHWSGTCRFFTFRADGNSDFSVILRADAQANGVELRYDSESRTFAGAPVGDDVEVEVFVDGPIIEAFISGRGAVTRRTYAPDWHTHAFFVAGEMPIRLEWQHVWQPCG